MSTNTKECPFCDETIKIAATKCRYCGEWLDGHTRESTLNSYTGEDKIATGNLSDVKGMAIGREAQGLNTKNVEGSVIQAQGDVILANNTRDEQYRIADNWEARGKPSMRGFDLSGQDLAERNFAEVRLRRIFADFKGVNLAKANLHATNLTGADLRGANLTRTFLRDAILISVDMSHANLTFSSLYEADLTEAVLIMANLTGADLTGAVLIGTNLAGATLADAVLIDTLYDVDTTWPDGFDPDSSGAMRVVSENDPDFDEEWG